MINSISDANPSAVIVDYVVEGPRTAAAVARGQTRLLGMSYAGPGEDPHYVAEDLAGTLRGLGDRPRVYHDSVFGCAVELQNDLPFAAGFDDTRIMLHLLEEEPPSEPGDGTSGSNISASFARVRSIGSRYWQLAGAIHTEGLDRVYQQIETPIVAPTLAMTLAGLHLNTHKLNQIKESHAVQLEIARRQIRELAGRDINLDSPDNVAGYLFNELGLPVIACSRSGAPSTKDAALRRLADAHPAVDVVRSYRQYNFVHAAASGLLKYADPSSGKVIAELDPLGASTGRFSCKNPNLQGIPRLILAAIEPTPGHRLLEADFSQCELRVLAHFSQDARLLDAYATADVDLHRRTAAAVLGLREDQVSNEQRNDVGKPVNFAIVYGLTAKGLAEAMNIPDIQAEQFLNAYFAAYPGVEQWTDSVHRAVEESGHVRTFFGRRRHLPNIFASDPAMVDKARRQAVNTIIQGTAADIIKLALVRLNNVLPKEVRMLLTIHDSVLLEVPDHLVDSVKATAAVEMQDPPVGFSVPLKVDVKTGRTWADCKNG